MAGYPKRLSSQSSSWRFLTPALLAIVAMAATPFVWALANSTFEATDGNLVADAGTDWQSFIGNGLLVGYDKPQGQTDDSFSDKEDNPAPEITEGSIPNNKSDLMRFYVVTEKVDVAGIDKVFLDLGWVRSSTLGSANMDFEFNQSKTLSSNGSTPVRTEGDLLITFGFSGNSNTVDLGLSRWHETGSSCEAAVSAPCWGPIMALSGFAEGSVNNVDTVVDPIEGVDLAPQTFGEAVINLTDAGVFDVNECVSFGSAYVKSRSSTSFTSSLKDFIEPIDITLSNCATIEIVKDAVPDDDQDFEFSGPAEFGAESFSLDDNGDEGDALPSSTSFQARFSGSVSFTEQPADGWDLTDVSCDVVGGSPTVDSDPSGGSVTVDVGPGDTTRCTFTNTRRGRIIVYQVTNPGADPQLFGFTLAGGPAVDPLDQTFDLSDGSAPHDTGLIRSGTYAIGQLDSGPEWDLTSATCDDGSSPSSVDLTPGETVTCTFTNTKRGRILVDQVTDPSGEPDTFDFTLAGGPDSIDQSFGLTDLAAPHDSGLVRPGGYSASQLTPPAGFDLESATCDDGSSPSSVALDPGETVTCTFTNVKRGHLIVDVVTDPSGDPDTFDFGVTGGPSDMSASFSLADLTPPYDSGMLQPGAYAISDSSPGAEWDLASADCDDQSDPSQVGLEAGETVTCTYTYVKRGHVLVDVTTDPSGEPDIFDFTLAGGPADAALDQAFGLADASAPHDSGPAKAAAYAVTPLDTTADWDLESATCSDGSDPSAVALASGEAVTCTFHYVKRGHVIVDVVTDPSADPHVFDFTLGGGPADAAVDQAFGLADASTPHDSGVIKPGSYAIAALDSDVEFDLGGATCSDGSAPSAVAIGAGETVTCTFTYVKRAHIFVDVVTDPSGQTKSFSFTLTGGPADVPANQAFGLTDGSAPRDSGALKQGGYTVAAGDPGSEWDLDPSGTSCDNGDAPASIVVDPGDSVTCTFTFVQRGHIRIDKITAPSGDPQAFAFTLTGGPDAVNLATSLTGDSPVWNSGPIRPGTYAAAEGAAGPEWSLTGVTCDDGSAPGSISLAPGEVVKCTFTNTKRAVLTIVKESIPDDPQDFGFSITSADYAGGMTLDDDADATLPKTDSVLLVHGTYTIVESDPGPAWDPTIVQCVSSGGSPIGNTSVPNRTAQVNLAPGASVTCTFTDTKRGRIFVEKYVVNDFTGTGFDPRSFPFDFDSSFGPDFALAHGEVHDSDWIRGGVRHTVSENPPAHWQVSSECTFADGRLTTGGASIGIDLPAGEEVHCTFINELTIHPGSSGFWRNWSNHYTGNDLLRIIDESLDESPVYGTLYDGEGGLIDDAQEIVEGLYNNGGGSNEQQLIRELTSMFFNVGVTQEPALQDLRRGDGLCLDCVVEADEVPGAIAVLENLATCPTGGGVWRVQDVVNVVEAAWTGNLAAGDLSLTLTSADISILTALLDGINDGRYLVVDASDYPNSLKCLSAPGPGPGPGPVVAFYRDADGDGYGDYDQRLLICDGSTPSGYVADDYSDCNDSEALSNPGMSELCDGIDNDCDGVVDSGADSDSDGIDDLCDAFPNDPEVSGPFVVGGIDVDELWQSVTLPGVYSNPVVIAGVPTYNDVAPGVVEIDNVADHGFEIRFKEWEYLDGVHEALESVSYMASEAGRFTMADGSIWEFGTFAIEGTHTYVHVDFSEPFGLKPAVFLTAQAVTGRQPVTVRARNIGRRGFDAALYEEEARMDGHAATPVGYVAIYSPPGFGNVQPLGSDLPYYLDRPRLDDRFSPVLSFTLKLDEEDSYDPERWHIDENVWIMAIGGHLFAQDVSAEGKDTVSPRSLLPEPTVAMEWGSIDDVADQWIQIPFAKSYTQPVVVVKMASNRDLEPGVLRIRNVDTDSFEVRFEEWSYLDGVHLGERVFYMVAEAGQHDLGGLHVEAGTLVTSATKSAEEWELVNLTAPFTSHPAVFAAIQTDHDEAPALTRVKEVKPVNFQLTMQEEEAGVDDERAAEVLGWIAVDMGSTTTPSGRYIEILMREVDEAYRIVHFTPANPDRRFRTVVSDMDSTFGDDPADLRHANLGRNRVSVMVQEEQSLDVETDHPLEEICVFVAE